MNAAVPPGPVDGELERRLGEAGERWRARQQRPPDLDLSRLTLAGGGGWAPRARVWAPLAAVAGIAAVLAAVVVPLALQRAGGEGAPVAEPGLTPGATTPGVTATSPTVTPPEWILPADQGAGVPVRGTGSLLREADGVTRFCADVAVLLSLPPAGAGCSPVFVLVTGVEASWFTNTATSGQSWSNQVRVQGLLRDGTLAVSRVEQSTPDRSPTVEPPVPCPTPDGGWRLGYGLPGSDDGSSLNRLVEQVRQHPDRYVDVWEGHPDGPPSAAASYAPTRMVYVVGTTGDVAQARAELSAIYPGNLCVHKVRHTTTDLEQVAAQLTGISSTPIDAQPDVIENRVRVRVVALNPATVAILDGIGREAMIVEPPLLRWLQ